MNPIFYWSIATNLTNDVNSFTYTGLDLNSNNNLTNFPSPLVLNNPPSCINNEEATQGVKRKRVAEKTDDSLSKKIFIDLTSKNDSLEKYKVPKGAEKRKRGPKPKNRSNLKCERCATTTTLEWRKGPNGNATLCNRCGVAFSKAMKRLNKNSDRTDLDRWYLKVIPFCRSNFPKGKTDQMAIGYILNQPQRF